jgi:hypothetical protein
MRIHLLAGLMSALVASSAWAAAVETGPAWGTAATSTTRAVPQAALGTITPANVFRNAQAATGGVGLRNRRVGSVEVSGAPSPISAAFLYWAVITNGPAPVAARTVRIQRRFPTPVSAVMTVTGGVVGTGAQACWIGTTITAFKARVPTSLATGSGAYELTFPAAASGLANGRDPWFGTPVLPLLEGASLVLVGPGNNTVAIYDRGLSAQTFIGSATLSYTLAFPVGFGGISLQWDSIAADGQCGQSRTAIASLSNEVTRINANPIAGPGSAYADSEWNGAVADPLPELWDNTSHNVTDAVPAGSLSMAVRVTGGDDCLTPVANVVGIR